MTSSFLLLVAMASNLLAMASNLIASLLLVVMPFVTSSVLLFLVVMPGATFVASDRFVRHPLLMSAYVSSLSCPPKGAERRAAP